MSNENSSNGGFGNMDEKKQKSVAKKGGKESHRQGQAHEFDAKEAPHAGKK